MQMDASHSPTPGPAMRQSPRVTTRGEARIVPTTPPRGKVPIQRSQVLNISLGGALILSTGMQQMGNVIEVELGAPIFPNAILVSARVAHVADAPPQLAAQLAVGKQKIKAYLLGVEFLRFPDDQQAILKSYLKGRVELERRQRDGTKPTVRDRSTTPPGQVPSWAYALGLLLGVYIAIQGLIQGQSDTTIALNVVLSLVGSWMIGRITAFLWLSMEVWRAPAARLIDKDTPMEDADTTLDTAKLGSNFGDDEDPSEPSHMEGESANSAFLDSGQQAA